MTVRTAALVLCLAVLTLAPAAEGTAGAGPGQVDLSRLVSPSFVVSGHGWGHGVGLSQWGAYGYARAGVTYQKILAHYYPHTTLGPAPLQRVRVLLATGARSVVIASDAPMRVKDGNGDLHRLAAGRYTVRPSLKLLLDGDTKPTALQGPLTVVARSQPLTLGARAYRGSFEVSVVGGKLQVVNVVGLEQYLYGVVPAEVPDGWPAEALKAQAVVARSYALSHLQRGDFDLYSDTRSQVYRGIPEEVGSTTSAVNATAGQVVLYNGMVASTYYFSTSGGRTAAVTDIWPRTAPVPYLVSVPDPYDTASPYHDWGPFSLSPAKLAKVLKVGGPLLDVRATVSASQRVTDVVGVGPDGPGPALDSWAFRRALGLRSTWFTIGELGLERPPGPVAYGTPFSLTGIARAVGNVTVEQQPLGSSTWTAFSTVAPRSDGTISVPLKPKVTTRYRLSADTVKSKPVQVTVAPLQKMMPAADGSGPERP